MIHHIFNKLTSNFNYFEENSIISYVNVYNYIELRKSSKRVESIDKFTLDGILLVILIRILFNKKFKRLSPDFSSYFGEVFRLCEEKNKKVYFIGASKNEIKKFVKNIMLKHPNLKTVGYSDGFFQEDAIPSLINEISTLATDLVFVGLGTPKQEDFAEKLKESKFKGTIYTCGAFISQTSNHGVDYYPKIINSLEIRWLYRLIKEEGLFKRYFIQYPFSILLILKDYLKK